MSTNVKFTNTTAAKLSSLPIADGQIIALSDSSGWYYDMGGTRHTTTGVVECTTLPTTGQSGILYVLYSSGKSYIYDWDSTNSKFVKVSSGSNFEELTWAEYQALSNDEKLNGTQYMITDGADTTVVDDTTISVNKAYSSSKIEDRLGGLTFVVEKESEYDTTATHTTNTVYLLTE